MGRAHPARRAGRLRGLSYRDAGGDREVHPAERVTIVDQESRRVARDEDAVPPESGHHARPELGDEVGAVLNDLASSEPALDRGVKAEPGLHFLDLDFLLSQVLGRDDEAEGDGVLVRVQEAASAKTEGRLTGE